MERLVACVMCGTTLYLVAENGAAFMRYSMRVENSRCWTLLSALLTENVTGERMHALTAKVEGSKWMPDLQASYCRQGGYAL